MISVDFSEFEHYLRNNTLIVLGVLYVLAVASSLIAFTFFSKDVVAIEVEPEEEQETSDIPGEIVVELAGAVNRPGVYQLRNESKVVDLLSLGGGLSEDAFTSWISKNLNMSRALSDSEKVYVPFIWDIEPDKSPQVSVLARKVLDAPPVQKQNDIDDTNDSSKVNLNLASIEDIDSLPGIGQVYAARIAAARPYSGIDELSEKADLPSSLVSKIESLVTF